MTQATPWDRDAGPRSEEEGADERLVRSGAPEVRGDFSARQDAERTDMPNLTDEELEHLIASELDNAVMANPPELQGFHLCWLTTSSQYDTIHKRQRVGYTPVMRSEMPNYDPSMGKALAGHEGMVTCNELVLHKIPERRYQVMMNLFHHKRPMAAEHTIVEESKKHNAKVDNDGGGEAESGYTMLERSVKFAEKIGEPRF